MPISGFDVWVAPKSVPAGTDFPGTVQGLVNLMANYLSIAGIDTFNGINTGPDEPDEANRDKIWYRIDGAGNPMGVFFWNGAEWKSMPVIVGSGATVDRPSSALEGQQFFDTDIHVMLVFERSQWRTLAGSPGDVKEVKAETLAEALKRNPGWVHDADSVGLVVAGADDTVSEATADADVNDHWYGNVMGEEYHNMTIEELVAHRHLVLNSDNSATGWEGPNSANPYAARGSGQSGNWQYYIGGRPNECNLGRSSKPVNNSGEFIDGGGGEPFNVRQPTIYYWRLVKQ
jgi:hypothetical protein